MTATKGNKQLRHITGVTIRLLLGLLFVVSAIAKLWSVDQFELYIYSYRFLPLDLSFILARLCIGAELALGMMLIAGLWRRLTLLASALILLAFSLFLGYAALVGRDDSCQCFGQLADMSPVTSLLKNAILLVLTLLCTKLSMPTQQRPLHTWLAIGTIAVGLAVPFVVSVPDSWMFGTSSERYDEETLAQILDDIGSKHNTRDNGKIVAFVTPGCPYCRMTRQKLDYMAQRHHLPQNSIIYLEPSDIGSENFLKATHGASPLILLLDDGEVVATFHYRNINERKIVGTLVSE